MTRKMQAGDGCTKREAADNSVKVATVENDTIAAIATAAGSAGIGIVRISGSKAVEIARRIFRPARTCRENDEAQNHEPKPYQLSYGFIIDPSDDRTLDEVLIAHMPAPRSYTREDVVEIQCHGGAIVLKKILELVLLQGARAAEPGEFTKRAFLNGRIDLTQAEAVADLINARCETSMKLAARQLGGGIRQRVAAIIAEIKDILAGIEAELEFGEDSVSGIPEASLHTDEIPTRVIAPMRSLLDSYRYGQIFREGFRLAIVGRPNVGKSSLLNRLIEREKAIVTPFPGTTRDPVEASLTINGVAVDVIDTAGLRESHDPVERLGILKSEQALEEADLVLLVIEPWINAEDDRIIAQLGDQKFLLVVNKIDLEDGAREMIPAPHYAQGDPLYVSAKTGEGFDILKARISELWCGENGPENEALLCDLRHKIAIEAALEDAQKAAQMIEEGDALEMIAMDLKQAMQQLQLILGEGITGDVLDAIFQKFCIGK